MSPVNDELIRAPRGSTEPGPSQYTADYRPVASPAAAGGSLQADTDACTSNRSNGGPSNDDTDVSPSPSASSLPAGPTPSSSETRDAEDSGTEGDVPLNAEYGDIVEVYNLIRNRIRAVDAHTNQEAARASNGHPALAARGRNAPRHLNPAPGEQLRYGSGSGSSNPASGAAPRRATLADLPPRAASPSSPFSQPTSSASSSFSSSSSDTTIDGLMDVEEDAQEGGAPEDDAAAQVYGCAHYRRRAKLIAPCCDRAFWCRHCHNEECDDNASDYRTAHKLDRHAVTEVECALCSDRQPKSRACRTCGVEFAKYYCAICSFYDDDVSKKFFHCDECGICRVGGRENFFHCPVCNGCYPHSLRNNHVCVQNAMHHNCPICLRFLFDSMETAQVLCCGHTIHGSCFRESMPTNPFHQCPVCKRNNLGDARAVWAMYDREVGQLTIPEEYEGRMVDVLCNDCLARSTVQLNFVGHKCLACGGYNTDPL